MMGGPISCLFCGERLSDLMYSERYQHIGRHMAEIAFGFVTKPYEDWEFYSDSSSNTGRGPRKTPRKFRASGL